MNIIDEAMEKAKSPADEGGYEYTREDVRAAIEHAVRRLVYEAHVAMACTQDREGRPLMHIDQIRYVTDRMKRAAGLEDA